MARRETSHSERVEMIRDKLNGMSLQKIAEKYGLNWVWLLYVLKRVERQRKIHDDRFVKDHQGEFHVFHPQYSPKYSNRS